MFSFPAKLAHEEVEARRNHFFELDEVNCGIGWSSFNVNKNVTMERVRASVLGRLSRFSFESFNSTGTVTTKRGKNRFPVFSIEFRNSVPKCGTTVLPLTDGND